MRHITERPKAGFTGRVSLLEAIDDRHGLSRVMPETLIVSLERLGRHGHGVADYSVTGLRDSASLDELNFDTQSISVGAIIEEGDIPREKEI